MNETYQNRITDQICKIQTDKKLIAFYDKLLTTTYNSFAQLDNRRGESIRSIRQVPPLKMNGSSTRAKASSKPNA